MAAAAVAATALLAAALGPTCRAAPRPELIQGRSRAGDLPPDPGLPGWRPDAGAERADRPVALSRHSVQRVGSRAQEERGQDRPWYQTTVADLDDAYAGEHENSEEAEAAKGEEAREENLEESATEAGKELLESEGDTQQRSPRAQRKERRGAERQEPPAPSAGPPVEATVAEEPLPREPPVQPFEPVVRQAPGPSEFLPHGDFQAFGSEDVARALTAQSIGESNKMIDQIERAEVAETKRSVYRALTRLRGAATSAYDGVAKSQMGNIDEYSVANRFRDTHEVRHLASQEGDVGTWAFPNRQNPGRVAFTAHASNVTRSGAGFWKGFFDMSDVRSENPRRVALTAHASSLTSDVRSEDAVQTPGPAAGGQFWARFFEEEEGLPDHPLQGRRGAPPQQVKVA